MLDKETVFNVIKIYKESWENQDSKKILSIFMSDAIYHERVLKEPYNGHAEIQKYWETKVIGEQSNIKFELLNLYVDGNTAIAEWDAEFDNLKKGTRIHMIEVAILEFTGSKIQSLREYWASESINALK